MLGSRARHQPAPPHVVFESLTAPHRAAWLELLPDEIEPQVMAAIAPGRVVWSTLWPDRPADVVTFDLEPSNGGCLLRWTLTTTGPAPDDSKLGHLRFRLNVLINSRLRLSYGQ